MPKYFDLSTQTLFHTDKPVAKTKLSHAPFDVIEVGKGGRAGGMRRMNCISGSHFALSQRFFSRTTHGLIGPGPDITDESNADLVEVKNHVHLKVR